jgi:translation initiation factor 5
MVEAERLEVTNKTPIVLCELLFDKTKILAQIKTYKRLLLRFCQENTKAQKYLIGGIEKTIETNKEALLPKTAHIFKALYDEDILDEEVILDWGKKVQKIFENCKQKLQIRKNNKIKLNIRILKLFLTNWVFYP